jgi:hypothetical protein
MNPITKRRAKRRRKPGRPRTGHDPVVTVRLPAAVIRKIDKMAAELGTTRSMVVRLAMEDFAEYGSRKVRDFRPMFVAALKGGPTVAPRPGRSQPQ